MSFSIRNLSALAYADGFTLWHYKAAADRLADVSSPWYFDDANDILAPGDLILIGASDGSAIRSVYHVGEGRVAIANLS